MEPRSLFKVVSMVLVLMGTYLPGAPPGDSASVDSPPKQRALAAEAAALHAEWSAALGTPRPGVDGATRR